MALYFASLNSGSNGNCYYIGNETEAVLIDAGISCRETERRMRRLDLPMERVKAILISHEHGDHIRGLAVLSKRYNLPVYMTDGTWGRGIMGIERSGLQTFHAHEPVVVGALQVTPFPKWHDAGDPHSFIVESEGVRIGVFTDIGEPCEHVTRYFSLCHAAFLEANYDEDMLEKGRYPYHLKQRIRGKEGHLSNLQALELFRSKKAPYLSHLLLSHLSQDNNDPQLVQSLFDQHAGKTKVVVASRHEASDLYCIGYAEPVVKPARAEQMRMF